MIILDKNNLQFRFPDVKQSAGCEISFKRTLRIPDDNKSYSLPPALGNFPLHHVDDYSTLPEIYQKRGGVFFPMFQSEAMWINFNGTYPCAVKIAAGKINAVSGKSWSEGLSSSKQDYIVTDKQPWLDGFNVSKGMIRQFVAMPLGKGFTAEEQITGESEFGGLQIIVYPMKAEFHDRYHSRIMRSESKSSCSKMIESSIQFDMGFSPGGLMRQDIYKDSRDVEVWDTENSSRCFIHVMNTDEYHSVTGKEPPNYPFSAEMYNAAGLPWFDFYSDNSSLDGADDLKNLKSVGAKTIEDTGYSLDNNSSFREKNIKKIRKPKFVREERF